MDNSSADAQSPVRVQSRSGADVDQSWKLGTDNVDMVLNAEKMGSHGGITWQDTTQASMAPGDGLDTTASLQLRNRAYSKICGGVAKHWIGAVG